MGHKKDLDKLTVQKGRLQKVLVSMLYTNLAIMEFQMTLAQNDEEKKTLKRVIALTKKAEKLIWETQHFEILVSLYNSFVLGKESYYVTLVKVITLKTTIRYWDKTKKGFEEFLKQEAAAKAKSEQEFKERQEQQEFIKKAQEQGKKVEFVLENGKLKPTIVDEKAN